VTMKELEEQRVCVKFCCKLGKNFTETCQLLHQAYGEDCMKGSPWPKKSTDESVRDQGDVFIFNWKGIVHHEFVPRGQMVNKQLYSSISRENPSNCLQHRPTNGSRHTIWKALSQKTATCVKTLCRSEFTQSKHLPSQTNVQ
jgi:hypothetical protein